MSSMVKVTNATDSDSAVLKQFRLDNHELEVCGEMVAPGASVTMPHEDWLAQGRSYERLVKLGALKVEDVAEAGGPALRSALVDLTSETSES